MSKEIVEKAQSYLENIPLKVVSQGAEAVIFVTDVHPYLPVEYKSSTLSSSKYIVKYRPPKTYRHPKLDLSITKSRTISEAKLLGRLYQIGISAPRFIGCDAPKGIIWMEYIGEILSTGEISSLKNWLWMLEKEKKDQDEKVKNVMLEVGREIAQLHLADIIHGDLTTSNIILTNELKTPTLIDFGLSSYSLLAEDKAVDLYVLERAFLSTHPEHANLYNEWLLQGYEEGHKGKTMKKYVETVKRLADVRMRGRKRSMLG